MYNSNPRRALATASKLRDASYQRKRNTLRITAKASDAVPYRIWNMRHGDDALRTAHATADGLPFVSVAIGICKSRIENLLAGVVQWQNGSFPSCTRGFDSPHPLFSFSPSKTT